MIALAPVFELEFEGGAFAVRWALSKVEEYLAPLCLDSDEIGTIEIVLAEALNNVVKHAYAYEKGPICISCAPQENELAFAICDYGQPMPDGHRPLARTQALDVGIADLPEGGFGWYLIDNLAKDICYERTGGANKLSFMIVTSARN